MVLFCKKKKSTINVKNKMSNISHTCARSVMYFQKGCVLDLNLRPRKIMPCEYGAKNPGILTSDILNSVELFSNKCWVKLLQTHFALKVNHQSTKTKPSRYAVIIFFFCAVQDFHFTLPTTCNHHSFIEHGVFCCFFTSYKFNGIKRAFFKRLCRS